MPEAPQSVVAPPRVDVFDVLGDYDELTAALQRLAAVTRLHQTECERLRTSAATRHDTLMAWRNANEMLETACAAAERVGQRILSRSLVVSRAMRATEAPE